MRKIASLYRRYLALGGKETAHIQAFLRGDLGANNSEDSCAAIAAYANAGRLRELMNWRGNKLEIGEKTIDLWTETSGRMYMTVLVAADSASGEDVPIDNLIPEELNGVAGSNNGLGIVIYHKDLLIVYYKGIYPINSYSLQNGKKCTYPMTVKKTIGARAIDPQTCRALAAGKGKTLAFDVPAKIETKDVYPWLKNIGEQYQGADILGTVVADIANDSQPVNVAKVRAMRRSPLPCEELLLDIMNQDGTGFVSGGAEDLLLRLQGISEKEHFRVDCSNNPRLRVYQGKTYVEMSSYEHPEGPDYFNGALYHHVRRAEDGKIVEVCDYSLTPIFSVRQESGSESGNDIQTTCKEAQKSLDGPRADFGEQPVFSENIEKTERIISDQDIDKDGKNDKIVWSCPWDAGSIVPADACTLDTYLTSGKYLHFEEQETGTGIFFPRIYQAALYIVVPYSMAIDKNYVGQDSPSLAPSRISGKGKLLQVTKDGFQMICPAL